MIVPAIRPLILDRCPIGLPRAQAEYHPQSMGDPSQTDASASERYLLLADISGYTGFLAGVEVAHGVDFSNGFPAGFGLLGAVLNAVVEGVEPDFEVAKLEGDAVFAVAPAGRLDGHGATVLVQLTAVHRAFHARREEARPAEDHQCTACPLVSNLDLKMVLHRGHAVRQSIGSRSELLGPAVNVAHRLLKNTINARIGYRPYLFLTDAAATGLGLSEVGLEHHEEYPDVGAIGGRIIDLAEG
jgi:class 3 adenylate cyclase